MLQEEWIMKTRDKNYALSAGFEPAREDPNGFLVHRLNHSATTTVPVIGWMPKYFMCLSVYLFQKVKKYILRFNWGSNPGPLACEASVITTTPLNRCTQAIPVLKLYTCKHDINNRVKKVYFVSTFGQHVISFWTNYYMLNSLVLCLQRL